MGETYSPAYLKIQLNWLRTSEQGNTSAKMGLNIEKLKNIIVSLEMAVVVEVGKVVERTEEVVVVSEPRVVVEVQERQVWRVVEV